MWNLANVQLGDPLLCLSGSVRATQWYPKAGWAIVEVPSPVTHMSGTLAGSAGLLFSSHVVLDHFHKSVPQDSENPKVVAWGSKSECSKTLLWNIRGL